MRKQQPEKAEDVAIPRYCLEKIRNSELTTMLD